MKKAAVLSVIFCIISSQIFADENSGKVEKNYFTWQLYNYYNRSNRGNNFLLIYPFENNGLLKITLDDYNRYLADTNPSFYDYIYLVNEPLGYYIYDTYQIFKFMDNIFGGSERRRIEQQESDRRYNILNPTEPPR